MNWLKSNVLILILLGLVIYQINLPNTLTKSISKIEADLVEIKNKKLEINLKHIKVKKGSNFSFQTNLFKQDSLLFLQKDSL